MSGDRFSLGVAFFIQRSTITTNLDYAEWQNFLGNKALVDALLSRLRHQCHTVRIDGPSLGDPPDARGLRAPLSRPTTAKTQKPPFRRPAFSPLRMKAARKENTQPQRHPDSI